MPPLPQQQQKKNSLKNTTHTNSVLFSATTIYSQKPIISQEEITHPPHEGKSYRRENHTNPTISTRSIRCHIHIHIHIHAAMPGLSSIPTTLESSFPPLPLRRRWVARRLSTRSSKPRAFASMLGTPSVSALAADFKATDILHC